MTTPDGFSASTPQHRTQLPGTVRTTATRSQIPLSTRAQGPAPRQPLANINHTRNSQTGSSGYGITAGMKVGRPPRSGLNNSEPRSDRVNGSKAEFTEQQAPLTCVLDHLEVHDAPVDAFGDNQPLSGTDFY